MALVTRGMFNKYLSNKWDNDDLINGNDDTLKYPNINLDATL